MPPVASVVRRSAPVLLIDSARSRIATLLPAVLAGWSGSPIEVGT